MGTVTVQLSLHEIKLLLGVLRDKQLRSELRDLEHQLRQGRDKLVELAARLNSAGHMERDPSEAERLQIEERAKRRVAKRAKLCEKFSRLSPAQREELLRQMKGI